MYPTIINNYDQPLRCVRKRNKKNNKNKNKKENEPKKKKKEEQYYTMKLDTEFV